jgi:hypothetical protein
MTIVDITQGAAPGTGIIGLIENGLDQVAKGAEYSLGLNPKPMYHRQAPSPADIVGSVGSGSSFPSAIRQ